MPLRLEVVDANHPNLVALLHGPLVLFAVSDAQPSFDKNALLQAHPTSSSSGDWAVTSAEGNAVMMRPFMNIERESYATYVLRRS